MDPITLGALLAGLIAKKALDRAGDEVVDAGVEGARGLVARVRARLARADAGDVGRALARVDDAPDSPSRERELAGALGELLERNPDGIYDELLALVEQARREGVQIAGQISQDARGAGGPVTQIAGNVSGVTVNQTSPRGGQR